ncbi:MAG: vanadium-dependent haloperoxidase [Lewinellaceae bacterium]|nr:vanadium-dependent haloperoxidase [Lewinellaceae bacterium]
MKYLYLTLIILVGFSCNTKENYTEAFSENELHSANQKLIDISMEDIFNPPVATRVFCYPNLVAFETYNHKFNKSVLNDLGWDAIHDIESDTTKIDYSVASLVAYEKIAKAVVFSEYMVDSLNNKLMKILDSKDISESRKANSIKYGEKIADQFKEWLKGDNYAKVKADAFYTNNTTDSSWVLTPPNFEPALEPNWPKMRQIVIKDKSKFEAKPRPWFSADRNSDFFKNAMMVYEQSSKNTDEERSIAKHWDCNPNEYVNKGHNTVFLHRISPPGHWVNITTQLCRYNDADLGMSLLTYAAVTTAMFDGIVSCWTTKYENDLIRPVTYINRYIDRTWEPYIQTPPFPEFTSGHSVASGTATSVLAHLYNNSAFIDSTEVEFGYPARKFESISQAGLEASNSRFYGGIHYKYGVDNGLEQGRRIGNHIISVLEKIR